MKKIISFLLFLLTLTILQGQNDLVTIKLKNGNEITGEIIQGGPDDYYVRIMTNNKKIKDIYTEDIQKIYKKRKRPISIKNNDKIETSNTPDKSKSIPEMRSESEAKPIKEFERSKMTAKSTYKWVISLPVLGQLDLFFGPDEKMGYTIDLAVASPRFVKHSLQNWNSNVDLRGSIEFPVLMQVLGARFTFGAEVGTFNFENDITQIVELGTAWWMVAPGDTYSGITAMGLMSFFPDSPGKIKIGAGIVGSSAGYMMEASYGFRVGKKFRIWGGIRSTEGLNAETAGGATLGRAGWVDTCVGITYN